MGTHTSEEWKNSKSRWIAWGGNKSAIIHFCQRSYPLNYYSKLYARRAGYSKLQSLCVSRHTQFTGTFFESETSYTNNIDNNRIYKKVHIECKRLNLQESVHRMQARDLQKNKIKTTGQVKSSRLQLGVVCNLDGTGAPAMGSHIVNSSMQSPAVFFTWKRKGSKLIT